MRTRDQPQRRSIRLRDFDYSQAGAYFVTIVTKDRACLLGESVDKELRLNDAGQMIDRWWRELSNKFPNIELDEYVVMPNHFHGIVALVGPTCVSALNRANTQVRHYRANTQVRP